MWECCWCVAAEVSKASVTFDRIWLTTKGEKETRNFCCVQRTKMLRGIILSKQMPRGLRVELGGS